MSATSTLSLKIRTGSADSDGILFLIDDELVAIIVELKDSIHGAARGRWSLEATFGIPAARAPETFGSVEQARDWVQRTAAGKQWQVVSAGRELL